MGTFCLLVLTVPKLAGRRQRGTSLSDRLASVAAVLLLMVMVGHDLLGRRHTAQTVARCGRGGS
jgi:hypothetical protein